MRLFSASRDQPAKYDLRIQAAIRPYMGRRPIILPKGTFYKKSPLESRKTAFGLYCPVFSSFAPRVSKITVHTAYPSSAPRCAYSAHREINPQSQSSVASNYQTGFCSQGIKRPAYTPPAFDGLYSLRIYPSYIR